MAEAQEPATATEPSMEEILASIRKIIADEDTGEASAAPELDIVETDVLELTQMVQDDGSIVDVTTPQNEEPVAPMSEPVVPEVAAEPVMLPSKPESLASDGAIAASANALSALANTVEIERLALPSLGNGLGNGGRTLEDMVLELMRPLLKDWLDRNLPATVDRLVQKEIERISKKVP